MSETEVSATAKVARGIVAGVIAGAVASFAMDRFQAGLAALSSSSGDGDGSEPATEKAADAIAKRVSGQEIAKADKPLAGQAMHYVLGIGLGALYGIAAEFRPGITAGRGIAFGIGTATLLDEGAVPALGLGDPPWMVGTASNIYSYASHLVFGMTSEVVRAQVAATLID